LLLCSAVLLCYAVTVFGLDEFSSSASVPLWIHPVYKARRARTSSQVDTAPVKPDPRFLCGEDMPLDLQATKKAVTTKRLTRRRRRGHVRYRGAVVAARRRMTTTIKRVYFSIPCWASPSATRTASSKHDRVRPLAWRDCPRRATRPLYPLAASSCEPPERDAQRTFVAAAETGEASDAGRHNASASGQRIAGGALAGAVASVRAST
ncbi:hypothetical protein B0H13DRAFT_2497544, partial [Mycena leptocephala]